MPDILQEMPCTHPVHLLGGPWDGDRILVPEGCVELYDEPQGVRYRHCPHATARFRKPCFIDTHIHHAFYAPKSTP